MVRADKAIAALAQDKGLEDLAERAQRRADQGVQEVLEKDA